MFWEKFNSDDITSPVPVDIIPDPSEKSLDCVLNFRVTKAIQMGEYDALS